MIMKPHLKRQSVKAGFRAPSFGGVTECGKSAWRGAQHRALWNPRFDNRVGKNENHHRKWRFYVACKQSWLWFTSWNILNIRVICPHTCATLSLHSSKLRTQPLPPGTDQGGIWERLYRAGSGTLVQKLGPRMRVSISSMCEKGQLRRVSPLFL